MRLHAPEAYEVSVTGYLMWDKWLAMVFREAAGKEAKRDPCSYLWPVHLRRI